MPNEIISPGFTVNCQPGVSIPVIKVSGASGLNNAVAVWFSLTDEWVVRLAGIEPTTLGFGGQYSIH